MSENRSGGAGSPTTRWCRCGRAPPSTKCVWLDSVHTAPFGDNMSIVRPYFVCGPLISSNRSAGDSRLCLRNGCWGFCVRRANDNGRFARNWIPVSDRWIGVSGWPEATELKEVGRRKLGWASDLCSAPGNVHWKCCNRNMFPDSGNVFPALYRIVSTPCMR